MHRILRALTVTALCLSLGVHWGVLQSMAWASMLAERLRTESVSVAIQKTFDGSHPCEICRIVQAGKAAENSQSAAPHSRQTLKLETFVRSEVVPTVFDPGQVPSIYPAVALVAGRSDPPPIPPPRAG